MAWSSASSRVTTARPSPPLITPLRSRVIGDAHRRIHSPILISNRRRGGGDAEHPQRSRFLDLAGVARKYYVDVRGLYRIFNDAQYRFYRKLGLPPAETDTPFDTNPTLPYEPTDTYGDGAWFLAVSYFNGVLDSGFLPLGESGERYLRVDISGGVEITPPPKAPSEWNVEVRDGGVIRVNGSYLQLGTLRATEWAITYTTDGSEPGEPPAVSPTTTVVMLESGLAIMAHDLPSQASGTIVTVRLQTRRLDGTWFYSEGSTTKSAVADSLGGVPDESDAALDASTWIGRLPEGL